MIRSVRVIFCHSLLGIINDRGNRIHAVAEANCITIVAFCRLLLEFGSPLDAPAAPRWSTGA